MNIPQQVSGRQITRRGVHLAPIGFHDTFLDSADYWLNLLLDMHISWVVALSESTALYDSGLADLLLRNGIIPIARFAYELPKPWVEMDSIEQLSNLYARYGAPLIVQFANEPFDDREWSGGHVPPEDEAWGIIARRWNEAAKIITERGAYAGFPDGPCYKDNPFEKTQVADWVWHEDKAVYLTHNYGKNRPVRCPYDDVSQKGIHITREEYEAALDDYADDPNWNELILNPALLNKINAQREEWAQPGKTAIDDDVCFLGYEKTQHFSRAHFGFDVPMMLTEGGWVPRDRAGSNPIDIRWPYTTPKMVAKKTLAMYELDTPFLAICPWLLACGLLGGSGWEFDAWVTTAYFDKYGTELPVVQTLKDNPPHPTLDLDAAIRELELASEGGERMLDSLGV